MQQPLKNMRMEDSTPRSVPFTSNIEEDSELLDELEAKAYRSGVGGLGWLTSTTRCDLSLTFSRLGQHLANPTASAFKALKQALRYIQGTKHYKISMDFNSEMLNKFHFMVQTLSLPFKDARKLVIFQ